MRAEAWLRPAALAGALLLLPAAARAYCRSTTCDRATEDCGSDALGCATQGVPVFWGDACIPIWLPTDSEPLPGIDATAFAGAVRAAFATWAAAECAPSIDTRLDGALECALTGYDPGAMQNVNTVRVVEQWPHPRLLRRVALTTVTSNAVTGELLDADIELNAEHHRFSVSGDGTDIDLLGTLTHEAGHVLGLDHSNVFDATMWADAGGDSLRLRTLDPDDEAGICDVYPPGQTRVRACELAPASDPAQVCRAVVTPLAVRAGCGSVAPGSRTSASSAAWLLCAWLLAWRHKLSARARRGS